MPANSFAIIQAGKTRDEMEKLARLREIEKRKKEKADAIAERERLRAEIAKATTLSFPVIFHGLNSNFNCLSRNRTRQSVRHAEGSWQESCQLR